MIRTLLASLVLAAIAGSFLIGPTARATPAGPGDGGSGYGVHSLRGAHGFQYSGSAAGLGPVASSGRIDFDGSGGLSAVFTTSVAGVPFTGSFTGTYDVEPDGTGSAVIDLPWLGTRAGGDFVIVDHGAGTFFTATNPGYSVTGRTERM